MKLEQLFKDEIKIVSKIVRFVDIISFFFFFFFPITVAFHVLCELYVPTICSVPHVCGAALLCALFTNIYKASHKNFIKKYMHAFLTILLNNIISNPILHE